MWAKQPTAYSHMATARLNNNYCTLKINWVFYLEKGSVMENSDHAHPPSEISHSNAINITL
jgi:hypothetical protein